MADDLRITNWPDNGSKERVALQLMGVICEAQSPNAPKSEDEILALYAKCRCAVFNQAGD